MQTKDIYERCVPDKAWARGLGDMGAMLHLQNSDANKSVRTDPEEFL